MKHREWFLYESVSEDSDTLTAVPRGNDPLDQYANMITVIDKQAYVDAIKQCEMMAEVLTIIAHKHAVFGVDDLEDAMFEAEGAIAKYTKWKDGLK